MQIDNTRLTIAFSRRKNKIATTVSFTQEHTQNKILGLPYPKTELKPEHTLSATTNPIFETNYKGQCKIDIVA